MSDDSFQLRDKSGVGAFSINCDDNYFAGTGV